MTKKYTVSRMVVKLVGKNKTASRSDVKSFDRESEALNLVKDLNKRNKKNKAVYSASGGK